MYNINVRGGASTFYVPGYLTGGQYVANVLYVQPGDSAPTFFGASNVNYSWDNIYPDLLYLYNHQGTLEELAPYINHIVANSYFYFGSVMEGGLCAYPTGQGQNISLALFQGVAYDPDSELMYVMVGFQGNNTTDIAYPYNQEMCIMENIRFGGLYVLYGGLDGGSRGNCYSCSGSPVYDYDLIHIRDVTYYIDEGNKPFKTSLEESMVYYQCEPIGGTDFKTPKRAPLGGASAAGLPGDSVKYGRFMMVSPPAGWEVEGSWYSGDDNLNVDPNTIGGTSTAGGGGGSYYNQSGNVPYTDIDTQLSIDAINSGLITIYEPTKAEIIAFNDFLFSGITEDMSAVLKRLISSPLDYVVSLGMIHATPAATNYEEIKFCGISSGVSAHVVDRQFQEINCGEVTIDENFATALDYGGYTKAKIYLPYCGTYPISIDDIMGRPCYVGVKYIVDLLTGSCIAQIRCRRGKRSSGDCENYDDVVYRFTGNCISYMPISATDWRNFFQGSMAIASGAGAIATGHVVAGASSIANAVMSMKPDVIRSGNTQIDYGYMDTQYPYLIFERPIQSQPANFGEYKGFPSNLTTKLKYCSGFTKVSDSTLWTNEIDGATAEECEMIKTALLDGVII